MVTGFDPWVGKITWRRERLPTPVFWPGEFHGLYSPWGHKQLDTTEDFHFSMIVMPRVRVPKTERIRRPQKCKSMKGFYFQLELGLPPHPMQWSGAKSPEPRFTAVFIGFRTESWQGLIGCRSFLVFTNWLVFIGCRGFLVFTNWLLAAGDVFYILINSNQVKRSMLIRQVLASAG